MKKWFQAIGLTIGILVIVFVFGLGMEFLFDWLGDVVGIGLALGIFFVGVVCVVRGMLD